MDRAGRRQVDGGPESSSPQVSSEFSDPADPHDDAGGRIDLDRPPALVEIEPVAGGPALAGLQPDLAIRILFDDPALGVADLDQRAAEPLG